MQRPSSNYYGGEGGGGVGYGSDPIGEAEAVDVESMEGGWGFGADW